MSEWIDCEENLPESPKEVLVAFKSVLRFWCVRIAFYTSGNQISYYDCEEFVCNFCENDLPHFLGKGWWQKIDEHGGCEELYDELANVLYWQELPRLPKD